MIHIIYLDDYKHEFGLRKQNHELHEEFREWLINKRGHTKKTAKNIVSHVRILKEDFGIDDNTTEEEVIDILWKRMGYNSKLRRNRVYSWRLYQEFLRERGRTKNQHSQR